MRFTRPAVLLTVLVLAAAAGCSTSDPDSSVESVAASADIGTLPEQAHEIMAKPNYATARWIYYVADAETGDVLLANRADEMVYTGSTAKNFTVGTTYDTLGPETRLTTAVYATAPVVDGVVPGDLVLVASGDLAMGGRGGLDGKFAHTFYAETVDHVYADIAPNARPTTDVGDPLAGLNELARQVRDRGVTRIDGDVVIDTRLWAADSDSGIPVTPIFVNDNILDLMVTAGESAGTAASIVASPQTGTYTVVSQVDTVAADGETELTVEPDAANPTTLVVSGSIAAGKSQLTIYRVPDAADWARTLFVEALGRAGVTVGAPLSRSNNEAGLPAADSFGSDRQLASIDSPALSAMGSMILQTSYNTGANAFLCLLAVARGSTACSDGLSTIYELVDKAGLDSKAVFVTDGQGAEPASTTPRQMATWVRWAKKQPWGQAFYDGQPVLGESGSLAPYGSGTPAEGKVAAKAGTVVALNPVTARSLADVQSLGGYLTLDDGTLLVFGLSMSGATFDQVYDGLVQSGEDVAGVAAAFQEELSK